MCVNTLISLETFRGISGVLGDFQGYFRASRGPLGYFRGSKGPSQLQGKLRGSRGLLGVFQGSSGLSGVS